MTSNRHDTPSQLDELMREAMELAARVNRRLSERTQPARQSSAPTPPPAAKPEQRTQ